MSQKHPDDEPRHDLQTQMPHRSKKIKKQYTQFQYRSQMGHPVNNKQFVQSQIPPVSSHQNQMKQVSDASLELFNNMKDILYQLSNQKSSKIDKAVDQTLQRELEHSKQIANFRNQISHYKQMIQSQQKKLKHTQESHEKNFKQTQIKHRKQIKKYLQLINEKQNEIQSHKKTIFTLNSKCLSLTQQIQSLTQVKIGLQNNILKTIDNIKSNFKEFNYSLEQNQSQKVVLEGKYKQLCDKIQTVVRQCQDSQNQRTKIEKKYGKLRENYQTVKDQCVQLKFQIERYKVKIRDLGSLEDKKQKKTKNFERQILTQNAKWIVSPGFQGVNPEQALTQIKEKSTKILQKIQCMTDVATKTETINNLNRKIVQLIKQNDTLKLELKQKVLEVDGLKFKIQGSGYEDQIIRQRKPSLYSILLEKKNTIQALENKIFSIQKIAFNVQEKMNKNIQQGLQTNQEHTQSLANNKTLAELQNQQIQKCKKQIHQELYQQFQEEKDKAIWKQRQSHDKINLKNTLHIKQLEEMNANCKKEIQKLRSYIEQLQKQKKKNRAQIYELNEQLQINKKKKTGKTKNKIRCRQCDYEFGNTGKVYKCAQCAQRLHQQCLKTHVCKEKIDEMNQESSYNQ